MTPTEETYEEYLAMRALTEEWRLWRVARGLEPTFYQRVALMMMEARAFKWGMMP